LSDNEPPPPHEIARVAPADVPGLNGLLGLAVGVVVIAALYFAREVLVPIMLAVLLSFVLAPVVSLLRRLQLPRVLAVVVTVMFTFGVIGLLAGIIGTQIASLTGDVPRYAASVEHKVANFRETTIGTLPRLISKLGRQFDRASGNVDAAPVRRGIPVGTAARPMQVELQPPPATPLGLARSLLGPIVGPLETTIIVVIVAIFILLQREDLRDRLIRLLGSNDLHRTTTAMDDAAARLGRYFLFQVGLNTVFGCVIAGGLAVIGVPLPLLWGVLAALLRFVPYIGSVLAALPPLVLAGAVGADWSMAIETALLFVVAEPLMGYVIEPMIYGRSTGLSPAAVIVAAIFWTWLWGPVGLVLSTPLTLCLVVLGRHFEALEFLDVLLGDRPALSPVESFYQRLLAGDADELLHQAEIQLGERSLLDYYDETALPGLRLAAIDAERGVLTAARLVRVRAASMALLADLSEHVDIVLPQPRQPAPGPVVESRIERSDPVPDLPFELPVAWTRSGAVLCIAARGVLDDAAATIMAQMLGKHGLGAAVVAHDSVSRERLPSLEVSGVLAICICGLELGGAQPNLRFLMRRLRQRLPGVPAMVAVWRSGEDDPDDRAAIGADDYAVSVRDGLRLVRLLAERAHASDRQMLESAFQRGGTSVPA